MFNTKVQNQEKAYEYEIFRPECPPGWSVLEQIEDPRSSYISFYRWGKVHHNAEPEKIFAIFAELNPTKNPTSRYTVRGGRNAKPDESLKKFENIKDAQAYLLYVMESTDKWLSEINSKEYIEQYNGRISRLVLESERRLKIK